MAGGIVPDKCGSKEIVWSYILILSRGRERKREYEPGGRLKLQTDTCTTPRTSSNQATLYELVGGVLIQTTKVEYWHL